MEPLTVDLGPGVRLRPLAAADLPELGRLYASTRHAALRDVPWSEAEKADFLRLQFECQHRQYREQYTGARFDVIERELTERELTERELAERDREERHREERDAPTRARQVIGRLYWSRLGDELRILDVVLAPSERRRGLGTRLLRAIIDRGRREGRRVSSHVDRDSPALGLWVRLGFRLRGDRGVYLLMVHPGGASAGAGSSPACHGLPSSGLVSSLEKRQHLG